MDDNVEENIPGVRADIMSYGSVAAPRGGNNFQYRPGLVSSADVVAEDGDLLSFCSSESVNTLVNTRHAITASWGYNTGEHCTLSSGY